MKLQLDKHEYENALWRKVVEGLKEEIDVLRRKNDAPLPEGTTAFIRGRIAALKELVAIGDTKTD